MKTMFAGLVAGLPTGALELWQDESGQDLIEYALVSALIALGAVASIKPIAGKLNTLFTGISTALSNAI